jgi:hypothetical protein
MTEDRKNLPPSASELHRVSACPGYLAAKKALPPRPEVENEDAASGTRCHAAFSGDTSVVLSDAELDVVARATRITTELVEQLGFDGVEPICEKRLFMGMEFTGKPDRVYIKGHRAFIPDLKAGRIEVEAAESNKQLRGYVVLLSSNYPDLTEILTCPIQPWVTGKPVPVSYGPQDICLAQDELTAALAAAAQPDAPRIPGSWCAYCPIMLAGACPEAREYSLTPPIPDLPPDITPAAIAATLTGPTLADFLERRIIAKKIIDAVEDEAKKRLSEDPQSVPGWGLTEGKRLEEITEPEIVFGRAEELGVTQSQFMTAVKLLKGKLSDAVKLATGKRGKELEAQMETLLAGCTTTKLSTPSLTKTKP